MVTKWFKRVLNARVFGGILANTAYSYNKSIKNVSNTTYYPIATSINWSTNMVLNANQGISIGSGDTAATDEDVNLETPITSGITAATPIATKGMDGDKCYVTLRYVLSNTTGADIAVKEVGLKVQVNAATAAASTSSTNAVILVDRTVLATPLTVPANSNAVLEYTLESDWDLS